MAKYSRKIKTFEGKQAVHPIKNKRQLNDYLRHFILEIENAKTPVKYYQAKRNYLLNLLGVNTAFRAEDLLQLRVIDVVGGFVHIKEFKTRKIQHFKMNNKILNEIKSYVEEFDFKPHDYLFMGQKKKDTKKDGTKFKVIHPISRQQFRNLVKKAAEEVNIAFKFGPHSLRKTFAYQYYKKGGGLLTLMKMLNHADTETTLLYIEWDEYDVQKTREEIYIGPK